MPKNLHRLPKLFEITYRFFYTPGAEGVLDRDWQVFVSRSAANKYAAEFVKTTNEDDGENPLVELVEVKEIKEIGGYTISLGHRATATHRASRAALKFKF